GRSDDVLRYDGVDVHPIVIRSVLVHSPDIVDYQVQQTRSGINVFAVANDSLDIDDVALQLRRALATAGLCGAHVAVNRVDALERQPASGKLRRFVPVTAG
ncbi:MAG TPA: phenylacetate--CoA ligase family protein, partial [Mycobacterium sp.]|nr:phenylacetate--CoA ligase family protein [Mycobacterium sp.]